MLPQRGNHDIEPEQPGCEEAKNADSGIAKEQGLHPSGNDQRGADNQGADNDPDREPIHRRIEGILQIFCACMMQVDLDVLLFQALEDALHIFWDLLEAMEHPQHRINTLASDAFNAPALFIELRQEGVRYFLNIEVRIQCPRTFLHTEDGFREQGIVWRHLIPLIPKI